MIKQRPTTAHRTEMKCVRPFIAAHRASRWRRCRSRRSWMERFCSECMPAAFAARISRRSSMALSLLPGSLATKSRELSVEAGSKVTRFHVGDRVTTHHHIPCRKCFYCEKKLFSQCEFYRRTGTTAGFEPAGGGFAEYVRVMDWIVEEGTVAIPDDVSFEEASFLEPLNTCLKALETAALETGEVVVVYGQGPVGLLMMQAASCEGAQVIGLDFLESRLAVARELGACRCSQSRKRRCPCSS